MLRSTVYYWRRPRELTDRLLSEWERRREPASAEPVLAEQDGSSVDAIHDLLGLDHSCQACSGFEQSWAEISVRVPGMNHHDGGTNTLRALWSAVRHIAPTRVVETGVARGFSSATILAAMQVNGLGHLWSIDLPEVQLLLSGAAGAAVGGESASRWTWMKGGSRRLLPGLLSAQRPIDLFIHDSLHTRKNMLFEMELGWNALRPGGLLFVDDIDTNTAFLEFIGRHPAPNTIHKRGGAPGAFGAILKPKAD